MQRGFYEFFAGGGMARAGLGDGWECLFANDIDPKKASVYADNWGSDALHVGDVGNVSPDQLPEKADLVWASFPCQDLSLAGAGAGLSGDRSGTFWPFWRLITRLADKGRKPRTIVLENVYGLLTSHGGDDFRVLCDAVGSLGYWMGALVVDAVWFTAQSRPRLFIIAIDQDASVPGHIFSPYAVDHWHPSRLRSAQASLTEARRSQWLWFSPPKPPTRSQMLADIVEERQSSVVPHSAMETDRLLAMMSPVNRAKVDLMLRNSRQAVGAIYKRTRIEQGRRVQRAEVRFDVAGCLRTPGGGSSRQTLLFIDDGKLTSRLITPRETARLMGLPDTYRLPTNYNDAYHVTGDGVAVPAVRHIAENLIEPALALSAIPQAAIG